MSAAEPIPETNDPRNTRELFVALYAQLRQIAERRLRERPGISTLQPTAVVNEAYMRLCAQGRERAWHSPDDFVRFAGRTIRNLLTDYWRRKNAGKRSSDGERIDFDFLPEEVLMDLSERTIDPVALDAALSRLEQRDPALAQLVELRFYAGQPWPECARLLGICERQAHRWWKVARVLLLAELDD